MCHKLICGKCSRALRRACPQISRSVTSGRASQVNALGARVQSCICWPSEPGAAGGAPQQLPTEIGLFAAVSDAIPPRRALKIRMNSVHSKIHRLF